MFPTQGSNNGSTRAIIRFLPKNQASLTEPVITKTTEKKRKKSEEERDLKLRFPQAYKQACLPPIQNNHQKFYTKNFPTALSRLPQIFQQYFLVSHIE